MSFVTAIQHIWKIAELRKRIQITLGFLLVYRLGAFIPLPGIDPDQLAALDTQASGGLLGLLNAFTGGAFAQASIMALGIMPYISASIVVQLMGMAVPYIQKLQKEGESGRNQINQMTRWLTIAICLVQAPAYITNLKMQLPATAFLLGNTIFWTIAIIVLVAGTVFAMWMGEKITDLGIGNGISLLITVGIVSRLPAAIIQEYAARVQQAGGGYLMLLIEAALWVVVIGLAVLLTAAIRKIPLQYARRSVAGRRQVVGARQYIPLKLNAAGVMPIIFAQAIMFLPMSLLQLSSSSIAKGILTQLTNIWGFTYNLVFAVLIVLFTYFYTAITVPTNNMADDLKKNNSFIPGIRPGSETAEYLDDIMSKITLPGAVFLALIAIFPAFAYFFGVKQAFALFFGGTSLLIVVGVTMDMLQQIDSYLLNRHYDWLMKSGRTPKPKAKIAP
ncbi:MAG: preprotein translocase subunit SecY [Flavobacteriales bacterium]